MGFKKWDEWYWSKVVRVPHLHILHGARLRHAQYVEQLQDQLLDVLQGVLLRQEVGVHLLLHLKNTPGQQESDWGVHGQGEQQRSEGRAASHGCCIFTTVSSKPCAHRGPKPQYAKLEFHTWHDARLGCRRRRLTSAQRVQTMSELLWLIKQGRHWPSLHVLAPGLQIIRNYGASWWPSTVYHKHVTLCPFTSVWKPTRRDRELHANSSTHICGLFLLLQICSLWFIFVFDDVTNVVASEDVPQPGMHPTL